MRVLLDTHAVVWAAEGDARLGAAAEALLRTLRPGEAEISDITLLEIAMLAKKERITLTVPVTEYLRGIQRNFPVRPINPDIAAQALELDLPQGDRFDRVIVATARFYDLALISRDTDITASGLVRVVW